MKYDTIVIGGGMAGYVAAIRSLEKGHKTALVNSGRSALHFSSGSVDLLGCTPDGVSVRDPFQALAKFEQQYPTHPYAKVGVPTISAALNWFTEMMYQQGMVMRQQENNQNHQRITTLGTLSSTFLSQQFVKPLGYHSLQSSFDRIVLLSIEGFRDFQTEIVADNLKATPQFKDIPIHTLLVSLPLDGEKVSQPTNLRSTDIEKYFKQNKHFNHFAEQISRQANHQDLIVVPAVFGAGEGVAFLKRLKQLTGLNFQEVPTMPPSLMGIRIEEALEARFIELGGVSLKGDSVVSGEFVPKDNSLVLNAVFTKNLRGYPLKADAFVLATGSFFSRGLVAQRDRIIEPVFSLDICSTGSRSDWHQAQFFSADSHPFLSFGVETNSSLNPSIEGLAVENLFCCGSVLAHYNPIFEGSGSGVAISTGYYAAEICNKFNQFNIKGVTLDNMERQKCSM